MTDSGVVNLLVALALMYILVKIPFWVLGSIRGGGRRSLIGSLVRGFIAYKTFGLLAGGRSGGGGGRPPRPSGGRRNGGGGGAGGHDGGTADPYARARTAAGGQYVLPLAGLRRTRPATTPRPTPSPGPRPRAAGGRQLSLPLGEDWPENRPILGRDGQYRLPLDIERTAPPASPASPARPETGNSRSPQRRARTGRQLELPFDPYKGNRPNRSGQYPLPLDGLRRTPRPPTTPPPAPRPPRRQARQLQLPFDPYKGNRATRSGQYPLPLDGLRRAPAAKPTPTPRTPAPPSPPKRPAPPAGRQLRLPLDLPKPPRHTPPPPRPSNPGGRT
jgi:hypothetical protein